MEHKQSDIELLPMDALERAAARMKTIAHPVRLRIVDILMQRDLSVREIAQICGIREHQICEHLRLMQNCGLLTRERQGREVHYRVHSPQLPALLNCVKEHCGEAGSGEDQTNE